jgi:hypothetical protein
MGQSLLRGTEGSNPSLSSDESGANLLLDLTASAVLTAGSHGEDQPTRVNLATNSPVAEKDSVTCSPVPGRVDLLPLDASRS